VKHLGNYIEIEIIGEDIPANHDILFDIAKRLSLEDKSFKKGLPGFVYRKNQ
jgi:adenylate cyclase class IV